MTVWTQCDRPGDSAGTGDRLVELCRLPGRCHIPDGGDTATEDTAAGHEGASRSAEGHLRDVVESRERRREGRVAGTAYVPEVYGSVRLSECCAGWTECDVEDAAQGASGLDSAAGSPRVRCVRSSPELYRLSAFDRGEKAPGRAELDCSESLGRIGQRRAELSEMLNVPGIPQLYRRSTAAGAAHVGKR